MNILQTIKDMFGSKKHLVAMLTILIVALNKKLGLDLEGNEVTMIVSIAVALIIGQGAADFGKGKLKAEFDHDIKSIKENRENE